MEPLASIGPFISPDASELSELERLQAWSEIVKNVVTALVLLGGGTAIVKWLYARKDRATDILLELEDRFGAAELRSARACIEDDGEYAKVELELRAAVERTQGAKPGKALEELDVLLRFYVLLLGVRGAAQVPDAVLGTCYRFWLAHYFRLDRGEFRRYVDRYFPTLRDWLGRTDAAARGHAFFEPRKFWSDEELIQDVRS